MTREQVYNILTMLGYEVYNIGQHYLRENVPYIVLKAGTRDPDISNRLGAYQNYDVLVYVPDTSIKLIDPILDRVEEVFNTNAPQVEILANWGEDYHDININMYMRSVTLSVPIVIRGCKT